MGVSRESPLKLLNRVVDAPKPHSLIAGTVAKPATLHKRHEAASANEYAVAKEGAVVAPRTSLIPTPRRHPWTVRRSSTNAGRALASTHR